jgi:ABC-type multidrug transport system fused ATPase/permease subunit
MDITIDGISYHYDGASDNLFENLSLSFPFGEKTAIV